MKRLFLLLPCAVIMMTVAGQKVINDPLVEKRSVSGFHAISVSGGIDLYLSQGNESVAVSASEVKYRDRIKTEVKDGVLTIWYEHASNITIEWGNERKMRAYVSFKNLDNLKASGGSDVDVDGAIKVGNLGIRISGGSDFHGKVEVEDLKVDASGGSDIHISGIAKKLNISSAGGSDFKGYDLATDVCELSASGGSDVYITMKKELSADASGGSDVYYKGDPAVRDKRSSGSSNIKKTGR
jgi:hypothetical protein